MREAEGSPTAQEWRRPEELTGVLDIGSNSIRFVIYAGSGRSPIPVFNERFVCALGREVARSGALGEDAMAKARAAIRRWSLLIRKIPLDNVRAVATAAVRESSNAHEFVPEASALLGGVPIEVVSGEEEARLSALGLLFGIPDADGVMADFGGGSLELAQISSGSIRRLATLPIGALRLASGDPEGISERINEALAGVDWLGSCCAGRSLYVVGGLWRNVMGIHMERAGHQPDVLHHYSVAAEDMRPFLRSFREEDDGILAQFRRVSPERLPHLKVGAQVLRRLAKLTEAGRIIASTYGLREGALLDGLDESQRAEDPLIAGARGMALRSGVPQGYGEETARWSGCLLRRVPPEDLAEMRRLHAAACLLSEISLHAHPDHRDTVIEQEILYSHLCGLDHRGRVFLAHAALHRHNGRENASTARNASGLLSPPVASLAAGVGRALRLAHAVSAGIAGVIGETSLTVNGDYLELRLPGDLGALSGTMVEKCMNRLAQEVELVPKIRAGLGAGGGPAG